MKTTKKRKLKMEIPNALTARTLRASKVDNGVKRIAEKKKFYTDLFR